MPEPIHLFVYGTLRPGEYNHSGDGEVHPPLVGCKTRGRIYFAYQPGSYPVAKLDEDGEIIGDILYLDRNSDEWQSIFRMETGAGYALREIEVQTPDGKTVDAVAWHYLHNPRGDLIEHGDWRLAAGIG